MLNFNIGFPLRPRRIHLIFQDRANSRSSCPIIVKKEKKRKRNEKGSKRERERFLKHLSTRSMSTRSCVARYFDRWKYSVKDELHRRAGTFMHGISMTKMAISLGTSSASMRKGATRNLYKWQSARWLILAVG